MFTAVREGMQVKSTLPPKTQGHKYPLGSWSAGWWPGLAQPYLSRYQSQGGEKLTGCPEKQYKNTEVSVN